MSSSKQKTLKASATNKAVAAIDADIASLRLDVNNVKLGDAVQRILAHVLRHADTRKLLSMDVFLESYTGTAKWVSAAKHISAVLKGDSEWRENTRALRKPTTDLSIVQAFVSRLMREPNDAIVLLNSPSRIEEMMPVPKAVESLKKVATLEKLVELIPKPDLSAFDDDAALLNAFANYRSTVSELRKMHADGTDMPTLKNHVESLITLKATAEYSPIH